MGPAKAKKKDLDNARTLGELIARRGWVVLTGGRDVGVMDAACEGAKRVGGSLTIGVLPTAKDKVSRHVDVPIITEMGSGRNNINVLTSHVVIACGLTGSGTVSEVALAVKGGRPVILVDASPADVAFFRKLGKRLVAAAASPEEAIALIMKQVEGHHPRARHAASNPYDPMSL
ncbi:MAG: LOG family protein [Nitrospira sp.]|nr:LOG family protein [Nitrospira sp.]